MRSICLFLVMLIPLVQDGARQDPLRMRLRLASENHIEGLLGGPTLPVKCDTAGNVYARFDVGNHFTSPIVKVNASGEIKARYSLDGVPDWSGYVYDFAIGPAAEVYLLAARMGRDRKVEYAIVTLGEDGKHRFTTRIKAEADVSLDQLAIFSSGEFLVAGWRNEKKERRGPEGAEEVATIQPALLVVNRSGDIVREVDLTVHPETKPADGEFPAELRLPKSAVSLARSASADDGHIYVLLRTEKPSLLAIPSGESEVRRVDIPAPAENTYPLDLRYSSTVGLVVQFAAQVSPGRWNTGDSIFSIVNKESGERTSDFQSSREAGGAFACYTSRGFLFLTSNEGKTVLRLSTPR